MNQPFSLQNGLLSLGLAFGQPALAQDQTTTSTQTTPVAIELPEDAIYSQSVGQTHGSAPTVGFTVSTDVIDMGDDLQSPLHETGQSWIPSNQRRWGETAGLFNIPTDNLNDNEIVGAGSKPVQNANVKQERAGLEPAPTGYFKTLATHAAKIESALAKIPLDKVLQTLDDLETQGKDKPTKRQLMAAIGSGFNIKDLATLLLGILALTSKKSDKEASTLLGRAIDFTTSKKLNRLAALLLILRARKTLKENGSLKSYMKDFAKAKALFFGMRWLDGILQVSKYQERHLRKGWQNSNDPNTKVQMMVLNLVILAEQKRILQFRRDNEGHFGTKVAFGDKVTQIESLEKKLKEKLQSESKDCDILVIQKRLLQIIDIDSKSKDIDFILLRLEQSDLLDKLVKNLSIHKIKDKKDVEDGESKETDFEIKLQETRYALQRFELLNHSKPFGQGDQATNIVGNLEKSISAGKTSQLIQDVFSFEEAGSNDTPSKPGLTDQDVFAIAKFYFDRYDLDKDMIHLQNAKKYFNAVISGQQSFEKTDKNANLVLQSRIKLYEICEKDGQYQKAIELRIQVADILKEAGQSEEIKKHYEKAYTLCWDQLYIKSKEASNKQRVLSAYQLIKTICEKWGEIDSYQAKLKHGTFCRELAHYFNNDEDYDEALRFSEIAKQNLDITALDMPWRKTGSFHIEMLLLEAEIYFNQSKFSLVVTRINESFSALLELDRIYQPTDFNEQIRGGLELYNFINGNAHAIQEGLFKIAKDETKTIFKRTQALASSADLYKILFEYKNIKIDQRLKNEILIYSEKFLGEYLLTDQTDIDKMLNEADFNKVIEVYIRSAERLESWHRFSKTDKLSEDQLRSFYERARQINIKVCGWQGKVHRDLNRIVGYLATAVKGLDTEDA